MMKCLICVQSETMNGFTSIPLERGEFRLVINHVPALVCPNCGESYLQEDVAISILKKAEKIFDEGAREDVLEY